MWIAIIVIAVLAVAAIVILRVVSASRERHKEREEKEEPSLAGLAEQSKAGRFGISETISMLSKRANDAGGHAYRNVAFEDEVGDAWLCDLVLICSGGFFAVDIEPNNGVITGSPDDETWTCTQGKSSQSIDNPIKANALRINAMRNLLGMEAPEILSLTVFPNANIDAVRSMQVADYSLAEQFLNIKIGLRHYSREEVERFNGMFRKFRKEHGLSFERYLKELAATS